MANEEGRISGSAKCPCGSGKKYKKCCGVSATSPFSLEARIERKYERLRIAEGKLFYWFMENAAAIFGERDFIDSSWEMFWGVLKPQHSREEMEQVFFSWMLFDQRCFENNRSGELRPFADLMVGDDAVLNDDLSPEQRAFVAAGRGTVFSWYCIERVRPGIDVAVRDLFDGSRHLVHEHSGSRALRPGDYVLARVIKVFGVEAFFGLYPSTLGPREADQLLNERDEILASGRHKGARDIPESVVRDIEVRAIFMTIAADAVERRQMQPQFLNHDGDPIEPQTLRWSIACPLGDAAERLRSTCTSGHDQDAAFEVSRAKAGIPVEYSGAFHRAAEHGSKAGMQSVLVAEFTLCDGKLRAEVNSKARAEEVKARIEAAFGNNATFESMRRPRKMSAKAAAKRREDDRELAQLPEVQAKLKEMAEHHWATWFDEKIPMLGNLTPRQAATTPRGCELLTALFREYERYDRSEPNPMAPDINHLKSVLGLRDAN